MGLTGSLVAGISRPRLSPCRLRLLRELEDLASS